MLKFIKRLFRGRPPIQDIHPSHMTVESCTMIVRDRYFYFYTMDEELIGIAKADRCELAKRRLMRNLVRRHEDALLIAVLSILKEDLYYVLVAPCN